MANSPSPWYVVGISGAPAANKTVIAHFLYGLLPNCTTRLLMQESFYYTRGALDEHVIVAPSGEYYVDQYNLEYIYSVDSEAMYRNIQRILCTQYDLGKQRPILILEGFRIFDDHRIRELVNLPIFIDLDSNTIRQRKIIPHGSLLHPSEDYTENCLLPCFEQYRRRCQESMKNLRMIDGSVVYNVLCNKVKKLVIDGADIRYRLLDHRPKSQQMQDDPTCDLQSDLSISL